MMSLYWGQPLPRCASPCGAVPHYDIPLLTNSLVFVSQCSNQWLTLVSACTPLSPLSVSVSVSSAIFVDVPLALCTVLLFVLGEQNTMKMWGRGVAPCILNFGSLWRCVITFISLQIISWTLSGRAISTCTIGSWMGPKACLGAVGGGNPLPLLRIRHWLSGCQALSLVTVLTELCWIV